MPAPRTKPSPDTVVLGREVSMHFQNYTVCAIDSVDFEIRRGEIFGVIGPAGAGKTTFLNLLAGRYNPTCGRIKIFGLSPARAAAKGRTGFVPDKTSRNGPAAAANWLGWLRKFLQTPPPAGLVQVLARKPDLVLLDNPFSVPEDSLRRETVDLLLGLQRRGATVVLSADSLEQAREVCQRVAILHGGRIEAIGAIPELLSSSASLRFIAPVISGPLTKRALHLIRQDLGIARPPEKTPATPTLPSHSVNPSATSADKILGSLVKAPPSAG